MADADACESRCDDNNDNIFEIMQKQTRPTNDSGSKRPQVPNGKDDIMINVKQNVYRNLPCLLPAPVGRQENVATPEPACKKLKLSLPTTNLPDPWEPLIWVLSGELPLVFTPIVAHVNTPSCFPCKGLAEVKD